MSNVIADRFQTTFKCLGERSNHTSVRKFFKYQLIYFENHTTTRQIVCSCLTQQQQKHERISSTRHFLSFRIKKQCHTQSKIRDVVFSHATLHHRPNNHVTHKMCFDILIRPCLARLRCDTNQFRQWCDTQRIFDTQIISFASYSTSKSKTTTTTSSKHDFVSSFIVKRC